MNPNSIRELKDAGNERTHFNLLFTADRVCYDVRDKVYGIYGAIPEMAHIYPPDYSKPAGGIFTENTAYLVGHKPGAKLYKHFGVRDNCVSTKCCPS